MRLISGLDASGPGVDVYLKILQTSNFSLIWEKCLNPTTQKKILNCLWVNNTSQKYFYFVFSLRFILRNSQAKNFFSHLKRNSPKKASLTQFEKKFTILISIWVRKLATIKICLLFHPPSVVFLCWLVLIIPIVLLALVARLKVQFKLETWSRKNCLIFCQH